MNFNSGNFNRNNNNRYNGQSVRPVSEPTLFPDFCEDSSNYVFADSSITREQLLLDLYRAYRKARRHKRYKQYQLQFERNLEMNLVRLRDAIWERRYKPGPSTCFIVRDPKVREVFAASFRDRVVHHLFYNYVCETFESDFIPDSYSCIKGRGTHYGIARLRQHVLEVSGSFSRPCYVLKMDVKGYFMNISREKLFTICRKKLLASPKIADKNLVDYLLCMIEPLDPTAKCYRIGRIADWKAIPSSKSLFCSKRGYGLPIGNLTSQLFSNVYLGELDNYISRSLSIGHYGRYVDDFYVVSSSKSELRRNIPLVRDFLEKELLLELNLNKTQIRSAYIGVEFLGAYVKPWRVYITNSSLHRMLRKVYRLAFVSPIELFRSLNSYLGVLSHYHSYEIRTKNLFRTAAFSFRTGYYTNKALTYKLKKNFRSDIMG